MELSPQQQEAKDKFLEWYDGEDDYLAQDNVDKEIFRIFGFAGTGKTTATNAIVSEIDGRVLYAAYTGKAALVMRRHGLPASTIHSLVYKPVLPNKQVANELRKELDKANDIGNVTRMKEIAAELKEAESIHFELNDDSDLKDAALLVLDECSMVNQSMLDDLRTFDVPLLVLGDPGQLPPIKGTGALISEKPNILLTQIHRQALENPIINLSFKARNGEFITYGKYGSSSHIRKDNLKMGTALEMDQVLCGKNVTRRMVNQRMRQALGRDHDPYPVPGEKLICLRNNSKLGIFNGMFFEVLERLDDFAVSIEYKLKSEDGKEIICNLLRAHFDEYHTKGLIESLRWWDFQEAEEFDFGYAITVHKSQGSQWDNVMLWDDKFLVWKKPERRKWLYTAITRAAETITIVS